MSRKRRIPCFCAIECIDGCCPNVQCDTADDKWGAGIAEDIGLEKTSCGRCSYNTGRCVDCTFVNTNRCDFAKKVDNKYITPPEDVVLGIIEMSEHKEQTSECSKTNMTTSRITSLMSGNSG